MCGFFTVWMCEGYVIMCGCGVYCYGVGVLVIGNSIH